MVFAHLFNLYIVLVYNQCYPSFFFFFFFEVSAGMVPYLETHGLRVWYHT